MKRIIFNILFALLALSPIGATENTTLRFLSCNLSEGEIFTTPLSYISLYFDGIYEQVTIPDNNIATVYCGEEVAARGKIEIKHDILSSDKIYPSVQIYFDSIMLPKGHSYQFLLPAGTIALERDEAIRNEMYNITFEVPEYLPRTDSYPIKKGWGVPI